MVRRHERVIATLLVWIAELLAVSFTFDRLNAIRVQIENAWYFSGGVIAAATSEEAAQVMEEFQRLSSEVYSKAQILARAELAAYYPYILLICAMLLLGGIISTLVIWRSVIVPDKLKDMVEAYQEAEDDAQPAAQSLASLLDADGEIPETFQPEPQQRQAKS